MEDNGAVRTAGETARQGLASPNRTELREGGLTSSTRLLELAHHEDKLLDRIQQLNCQGVLQLQSGSHAQALHFFQQCESTLEYAAGCGRTLDRSLILSVLNNQATAYQRCQQHERAASYVEAIIYNLNLFLECQQNRQLLSQLSDRTFKAEKGERESLTKQEINGLTTYAARKYDHAVYLLQFAGLQSQCMQHEDSLSNARKAVQAVRELSACSWKLESLRSDTDESKDMALLEELSQLPLMIDRGEYESLRREFERLMKNKQGSSTALGSQLSLQASLMLERANFQEIFSLRAKQVNENIAEPSSAFKHQPFTSQHYLQEAVLAICAYFTIGAELQQLNGEGQCSSIYLLGPNEPNREGECYHLMALILGYRHLPANNKFLQELLRIYRETYHVSLPSINHLDQLTQKYKNYLVEKDISISLDESEEKQVDPQAEARWNEQKKESKKLNELLKQEPVTSRSEQENYFLQVPSIDSIQIATSLSNRNKTNNSTQQPPKRNKVTFHPKLKASRNIDYEQQSKIVNPTPSNPLITERPKIQDYTDRGKASSNINSNNNHNNNSSKKSKSKKSKSRGKLIETKKIEKCQTLTAIPMLGLMTTITERSSKKLKPKRSPQRDLHAMIGSAGVEHARWADPKKINNSQQIKLPKTSQFSSVKNIEPIRLNKVKGATKMGASSGPGLHQMRSLQVLRWQKGSNQRSGKGKSKGKSSASFKSKKSHSNSSSKTPLKKNLTKTLPSKDKIYTSIKQTIRRR